MSQIEKLKMALIIGGNPNGFFSGKLGGTVYAHNRAGQYVRQYIIPVNPATSAQDRARSRFAGASGTFHALSAAEKANWGDFAESVFSPKIGENNGQFSGFNAFVSLKNVTENGNNIASTVTGEVNGAAVGTALTFSNFSFNESPPVFALQPALKEQTTGNALNLSLSDASVTDDGLFEVTIAVDGAPSGGSDIEDFIDPNDQEFGFLVQMSKSNPQSGMFFSNPYRYTLGYIKHPTADAGDRTGVETIGFVATSGIDPGDYQAFPVAGDFVKITVYAASVSGMLALIGSLEIEIDSA